MMKETSDEKPPILKSWRNVYILVVLVEIIVIVFLYFFTLYFR